MPPASRHALRAGAAILAVALAAAAARTIRTSLVASAKDFIAKQDYKSAEVQLKSALQKQPERGEVVVGDAASDRRVGDVHQEDSHAVKGETRGREGHDRDLSVPSAEVSRASASAEPPAAGLREQRFRVFMSSSQAYRDSDEMASALAYLIPTWCYSRLANPSTYYYEWTLALLEGYGFDGETTCCSTSSGMAAIMTAVQPCLMHTRHNTYGPRNFLATAQCYGGTFQQFNVRLQQERDIECRWIHDPTDLDEWAGKIDENTRFLYGELPSNPQQGFFDIQAVADLAHAHHLPLIVDNTIATRALLRPIPHRPARSHGG